MAILLLLCYYNKNNQNCIICIYRILSVMPETLWPKHKRVFMGSPRKGQGYAGCPHIWIQGPSQCHLAWSVSLVCPSSRLHSPWDGRMPTNGWRLLLEAEALSSQPVGRAFNCISLVQIGYFWINPCGPGRGSALIGGLPAHAQSSIRNGKGGGDGSGWA